MSSRIGCGMSISGRGAETPFENKRLKTAGDLEKLVDKTGGHFLARPVGNHRDLFPRLNPKTNMHSVECPGKKLRVKGYGS